MAIFYVKILSIWLRLKTVIFVTADDKHSIMFAMYLRRGPTQAYVVLYYKPRTLQIIPTTSDQKMLNFHIRKK